MLIEILLTILACTGLVWIGWEIGTIMSYFERLENKINKILEKDEI